MKTKRFFLKSCKGKREGFRRVSAAWLLFLARSPPFPPTTPSSHWIPHTTQRLILHSFFPWVKRFATWTTRKTDKQPTSSREPLPVLSQELVGRETHILKRIYVLVSLQETVPLHRCGMVTVLGKQPAAFRVWIKPGTGNHLDGAQIRCSKADRSKNLAFRNCYLLRQIRDRGTAMGGGSEHHWHTLTLSLKLLTNKATLRVSIPHTVLCWIQLRIKQMWVPTSEVLIFLTWKYSKLPPLFFMTHIQIAS